MEFIPNEMFYVLIGMFISTFGELAFSCGQCLRERYIFYRNKNENRKDN